jgi:hypothetical protein
MNVWVAEPNLSRTRDVGDILGGAFRLYRRRFWLFATIAFAVVIPIDIAIYGIAGELLWSNDDFADSLPTGAAIAAALSPFVVITPLITAGHVRAVMDLAESGDADAGTALAVAARRLPAVAVAVTLAQICSTFALLLIIVPGVYLWVSWWVSAQAVVAEDLGPLRGMSRSRQLVKGNWWRTFGIALLISLIGGLLAFALGIPFLAAGALAGSGIVTLLGQIVLDGVIYSFTALAGTFLFFDLKAREGGAPARAHYPEFPPRDLEAPERP